VSSALRITCAIVPHMYQTTETPEVKFRRHLETGLAQWDWFMRQIQIFLSLAIKSLWKGSL